MSSTFSQLVKSAHRHNSWDVLVDQRELNDSWNSADKQRRPLASNPSHCPRLVRQCDRLQSGLTQFLLKRSERTLKLNGITHETSRCIKGYCTDAIDPSARPNGDDSGEVRNDVRSQIGYRVYN